MLGGVVEQGRGPAFTGWGYLEHLAVVSAIGSNVELGGHDVIEEGPEGFDDEVESAGNEHGPVAERTVFADSADGSREALGEDELRHHLGGVFCDLLDGGAFVAPVERAEEVAAVHSVHAQQGGAFPDQLHGQLELVVAIQAAGGKPGVAGDDVRGDEGVLEVEGGELTVRR